MHGTRGRGSRVGSDARSCPPFGWYASQIERVPAGASTERKHIQKASIEVSVATEGKASVESLIFCFFGWRCSLRCGKDIHRKSEGVRGRG